jgi:fatty-acid desaturase
METESKRLSTEKATIEKEVHGYEAARDGFVERSFWFEIAFACLQAGVVLSTIAAAAKKKGLWLTAMVAGLLGALFVVNGLGHFVQTSEYSRKVGAKLGIQDPLKPPAK